MESPMNSSADKTNNNVNLRVPNDDDEDRVSRDHEESGWTAYLEDFSCSDNSSPSLISDAAWYGSDNAISPVKRLNFKNLKRSNCNRKKYACDDDLEDTASSPVNSPKVSTLKQMELNNNNQRTDDAAAGNFSGKRAGSTSFSEPVEEKNIGKDVNIDSRNNIDQQYVDLRKRGLCVVPMSALINYFG